MILETYEAHKMSTGAWARTTEYEEFDNKVDMYHKLFIYKLRMNLGYRIYDCDLDTYHTDKNKDKHIVEEWFDKASIRRTQQ